MNTHLTDMANPMAALEFKVTKSKQEVSSNAARIDEAEQHIGDTEETMEKVEAALELAIKRITYLESKTNDLENRGRRKKPLNVWCTRGS